MRIFLSYAREDKAKAYAIAQALSPYHKVWADWEDIPPGADWRSEILKGIIRSQFFIFLVSEHSTASPYCREEVETALNFRKKVIPAIEDQQILPERLARLQWVFVDEGNYEKGIRDLLSALKPRPSRRWVYVALVEALIIGVLLWRSYS